MSYPTLHSQHLVELELKHGATIIIVLHSFQKRNTIHNEIEDQEQNLLFSYQMWIILMRNKETIFPENMNSTKKSTILPIFYFPGPDTL